MSIELKTFTYNSIFKFMQVNNSKYHALFIERYQMNIFNYLPAEKVTRKHANSYFS